MRAGRVRVCKSAGVVKDLAIDSHGEKTSTRPALQARPVTPSSLHRHAHRLHVLANLHLRALHLQANELRELRPDVQIGQ